MRWLRSLTKWWRSSIQTRVVTTTLTVGIVTIVVLGAFLTATIRDGLFETRLQQALEEASGATRTAQSSFNASTAQTGTETQTLVDQLMPQLQGTGASKREIVLLRVPAETAAPFIQDKSTREGLESLITPALRNQVDQGDGQYWQSVSYEVDGKTVPGIVVGERVDIKVVGAYELYFIFSLEPEQETLTFIQNVLLAGSIALLGLLAILALTVTRQVVKPVQEAADTAEQLAAGRRNVRMEERGEDEMARLAHSFNGMAQSLEDQIVQLEELSALQRRFVSDVSHELRTPLTTIRMASEVLFAARSDFEPVHARSAELLQTQLDRFEALLADLLEISRFDAGAAQLDAEDGDLSDVVRQAMDLAEPLAESKGISLRLHEPEGPVRVDIDRRRVERVVRNLVVNAIEHADGQPVDITIGADARAVAVVVRDYGVGMTAEESAHVFDRFWRADPARARTTGGTGLGLAISLEDAHLHGGRLEAWGRPSQGASFRLTLPRSGGTVIDGSPLPLVEDPERVPDPRSERASPAGLPDFDGLGDEGEDS